MEYHFYKAFSYNERDCEYLYKLKNLEHAKVASNFPISSKKRLILPQPCHFSGGLQGLLDQLHLIRSIRDHVDFYYIFFYLGLLGLQGQQGLLGQLGQLH